MSVQLNHTIIQARDNQQAAYFLAEILGLPAPIHFGPFMVVKTNNEVSLDFVTTTETIQSRHFAFLVSESEFDEILGRVSNKNITYWPNHRREHPGKINHNDGGRGFYFLDPNGHFLEILTRPYES